MNLLVYSAYYEPEVAASLYLSTNLYEDLAKSGIHVTLYTPLPTRGVDKDVREKYRNKIERKFDGKLEIIRINLIGESGNLILRALRYLWMNLKFIQISRKADANAIFVHSTPPTQGAMAAIIKIKRKMPFIYNLQDIFPDSLVNAGVIKKNSLVHRICKKIENFTYKHADKIIVISDDMLNNIIKKGVPKEKIIVVPNWVDPEIIHPVKKENNYLYEKFGISKNCFNIVYGGNLGHAQNIDVIIKAAELLVNKKDIRFIIFGKGAQEEKIKKCVSSIGNVHLYPIQPYSEVSYVYSLGDAAIVSCKKGFGGCAMPSKTWSIMATGTPVLASFDTDTELENIIVGEKTGLFSKPNDYKELAANILKLYNNRSLKDNLGKNARRYVVENLERSRCTSMYIKTIIEIMKRSDRI